MSEQEKTTEKAKTPPPKIEASVRRCQCGFTATARTAGVADEMINGHVSYAVTPANGVAGVHWRRDD
jgi:hypothetical protein